ESAPLLPQVLYVAPGFTYNTSRSLALRHAARLAGLLNGEHRLGRNGAFLRGLVLGHDPDFEHIHVAPIIRIPDEIGIASGLRERGERLSVTGFQLEVRLEEHGASSIYGFGP